MTEKEQKKIRKRYIKEHGKEVAAVALEMNLRQRNSFAFAHPEKEAAMASARDVWDKAYNLGFRIGYATAREDNRIPDGRR